MKTNEIFVKTSFKFPATREYELGTTVKLIVDAVVVARQDQDNQDGTKDVIIKVKPTNVIVEGL